MYRSELRTESIENPIIPNPGWDGTARANQHDECRQAKSDWAQEEPMIRGERERRKKKKKKNRD